MYSTGVKVGPTARMQPQVSRCRSIGDDAGAHRERAAANPLGSLRLLVSSNGVRLRCGGARPVRGAHDCERDAR